MGSQACHDALVDAPTAIVLMFVENEWRVARKHRAWQPNREGGGLGPVVVTYRLEPGLFGSESHAEIAAATIIAVEKDKQQ